MFQKFLGKAQKTAKPKEPAVLGAAEHAINPKLVSNNALRVIRALEKAGYEAYIVGGAVRDLLLGIQPKDFDVATNATPEQVRRLFRRAFLIGRRFQIVHVMFGQDLIEVTTFRGTAGKALRDESGRLLRDNTFGTKQEDALRRDFTVNAMYYNPTQQTLLDYHGGIQDLKKGILRIIGDPAERFREDPVRMLRIVRFAAKLEFRIDGDTLKPISALAPLINNVPSARLFDEMLKLLMSGHALACLKELRKQGLHYGLLPLLDVVLDQPDSARFVELALGKTDERIREDKTVSPGFLFAALLWTQLSAKWQALREAGEYPIPALHAAANEVLETQTEKLALQRRIISDMRDIWALQPRLERRTSRTAYKLLENARFRAAYDFLLLRCESGEVDSEIGEWWTAFIEASDSEKEALLKIKFKSTTGDAATRRRKRPSSKKRSRKPREEAVFAAD